ncbi:MAG: hypothetical protein AB7E80_12420 [Hyphomicrobiaceae bacterium]
MTAAVLGMLVSLAVAVWAADPIRDGFSVLVAAFMLTVIIAPFAWAFLVARRNLGPQWTHLLLLAAVVFASGLAVYVGYVFINAEGRAKDPLMLAGAIVYQTVAIGGAVLLNKAFR